MTESRGPFLGAADGPLPRTGAEELAAGSDPRPVRNGEAVIVFVGSAEYFTGMALFLIWPVVCIVWWLVTKIARPLTTGERLPIKGKPLPL